MIPRLHPRGKSFKGVSAYILHDTGKDTAERVSWTLTQNLASEPKWAWHEMYETATAQAQLKAASGHDARGRKNNKPVLHYTLSWHEDDKPTTDHMQAAALASLKAMGLGEHEALIAAHHDKKHDHVHIVVNTVHPETGMTAPMKFSKLELSKWAEAYEREHGIHCEDRIKNNEERKRVADERAKEATRILEAASKGERVPEPAPYVPVKHQETPRKQWFERREIVEQMTAMRAALDQEMKSARAATWARQSHERDGLDAESKAKVDRAREHVQERYRPQWRDLYRAQKKEVRHVERMGDSLFERAVFVFHNRDRLRTADKPLTFRQMVGLVRSSERLQKRVAAVHKRERRNFASSQKVETQTLTDAVWREHRARFAALRDRQAGERQAERDHQAAERKTITFAHAKAALVAERAPTPEPSHEPRPIKRGPEPERTAEAFQQAAAPLSAPSLPETFQAAARPEQASQPRSSRAVEVKRQMDEWRKRNGDRDFGREL